MRHAQIFLCDLTSAVPAVSWTPQESWGRAMAEDKTVIVTGASQGIGTAVVQAFLGRGYSVVATSRNVSRADFKSSPKLALVDGDIGLAETAEQVTQTAIAKFGSIDHVVNNAASSQPNLFWTTRSMSFAVSSQRISRDLSS